MNRLRPSISWDPTSAAETPQPPCSGNPPPSATEAWSHVGMDAWEEEVSGGKPFDSDGSFDQSAGFDGAAGFDDGSFGPSMRASARVFLLPLHYEPNYRYPLVVWLHSDGYNEHQVEHVMPHVSLRNYVAVGVRGVRAADSIGHRFDWSFSAAAVASAHAAIAETVDEAASRFSIHPSRVVLAGYRTGGTMALRVAMRAPSTFAAAISLGGPLPRCGGLLGNLPSLRTRRLPMLWQWAHRGDRFDPETLNEDLRSAMLMRAQVEVRQYADDDEMNTVALADLNEWVMRRVVAGEANQGPEMWSSSEVGFSSN